MEKYINAIYVDLINWRDSEIELGNMKKAKRLHILSRSYKYKFYN